MNYLAVRLHKQSESFGELQLDHISTNTLLDGFLRVKMIYAPINPADLNMIEGRYVIQPDCPFTMGNEGVGLVEDVGNGCDRSWIGKRVICPVQHQQQWFGFWTQYVDLPFDQCVCIPDFIDDEQASMLSINPLTALVLLDQFGDLKSDDWIIQNAANSGLGRWVIYLANQKKIKTVNVVRRDSLIDELIESGADEVIVYEAGVAKKLSQRGRCRLALNGVGGGSAKELSKWLTPNGTMVTYGAMSKEPVVVGNVALIYHNIVVTGFNRSVWAELTDFSTIQSYYDRLFSYLNTCNFSIPIHKIFALDDFKQGIVCAAKPMLNGKVLLRLN